jgi:LuxR family maltose regulon positive regulatory protein
MSSAILATKLHTPSLRPKIVPRPRLLTRLQAGLRGKLTLVSAPAGFGKTTLISAWLKGHSGQTAWLSLDPQDNEPDHFLLYLVAAIRRAHPELGEGVLESLETSQPKVLEPLLSELINELADLPDSLVVILDDYHVITEPAIQELMLYLLEHQPGQLHLLIASRMDPPWPLARLRAQGAVNELRAEHLRFTPEESGAFLNDLMGLEVSPDGLAALDARTEGWIAGLQLAALSMRGRKDVGAFIEAFSGSHRFVLDYLVEEVLEQQTEQTHEFLLSTSILERFCAPLCDTVTGRNDSQDLLVQLDQANLFLVPLDDKRCWYRYHHLFGDLLRSRLSQHQAERVPELHARASAWFEYKGSPEEAISHAVAAEDFERAARQIEQNGQAAILNNKETTLSRWLQALPEEVVRASPWLCFQQAYVCQWLGRRDQVEQWLARADGAPEANSGLAPDEARRLAGYSASLRAHHALISGQIPKVVENAQRALELVPSSDAMHLSSSVALGGAYWALGDVGAAEGAFASAREGGRAIGAPLVIVTAGCYMGTQQAKQGRLKAAQKTYQEALEAAVRPDGRPMPVAGFPAMKLGDLFREWDDLAQAESFLARGLPLCERMGQTDILSEAYVAQARFELARRAFDRARATIQKCHNMIRRSQADPWVYTWLDECCIRLWLATDNLEEARRWAVEDGPAVDGELDYHRDLHHMNLARVLVAQGRRQNRQDRSAISQALPLLERLLLAAEKARWVHAVLHILTLQALALEAKGEQPQAQEALARALRLAEPNGFVRTFTDEGPALRPLLKALSRREAIGAYARRLAAALDSTDGAPVQAGAAHRQSLPEPLTKREIQVLKLLSVGLSSPEIAAELYIAVSTVRTHIKNIYGKLDVHGRLQAVLRAEEVGLL